MSNIVPFQPASALPSIIAQQVQQAGGLTSNPLSEGVGASYAVLSIKGKVFRVRHGGQDNVVLDASTGQPVQTLELIIVDAKPQLSKTYYAAGYVEGTSEQPDCASEDGVTPHAPPGKAVQCSDCRLCPWNVFGSKKSTDGVATNSKACADTRKIAVVPANDIDNARFGGPMLLRIPAASLSGLADFDRTIRSTGAPFYAVVAQVSFDYTVAFPKLVFKPLRFITDAEATQVLALRADPRVQEIVDVQVPAAAALPAAIAGTVPTALQAPVVQAAPQLAPPVVTAPAPVVQAQPQLQPVQPQPQAQQAVSFGPPPVAAPAPVATMAPSIPQTAPVMPPPAAFVAPGAFVPPTIPAPQAVPQPAPVVASALPEGVLNHVDALLGGG